MKKTVITKAKIPVVFFREGKSVVAYTPILDFSSCGDSLADAQRRFSSGVKMFLDELIEMGTLDQVLTELGWKKSEHPRKEWIPPHLLKHTQMDIKIPAYA